MKLRRSRRAKMILAESLESRRLLSASITTVASFAGATDANPSGGLVADSSFNLYGTTIGAYGTTVASNSSVFELPHGAQSVDTLGSIAGVSYINGPLVYDATSGSLFGTTQGAPTGQMGSAVFQVSSAGGTVNFLANSPVENDIVDTSTVTPYLGPVVEDSGGNLFGIYINGGDVNTQPNNGGEGWGGIWELPQGQSTLVSVANFNQVDGTTPGSIIIDSAGNLYGTTLAGGDLSVSEPAKGYTPTPGDGTVWEIPKGSNSIVVRGIFEGTNGAGPQGALTMDSAGDLFGTTQEGGASGDGAIFEIPAGQNSVKLLAQFNGTNGSNPQGVILDSLGNLFGVAPNGGNVSLNNGNGFGIVYELPVGSSAVTDVANFSGVNGNFPVGKLVADSSGNLWGETIKGGPDYSSSDPGNGTLFEVTGSGYGSNGGGGGGGKVPSLTVNASSNTTFTGRTVTFNTTFSGLGSAKPSGTIQYFDTFNGSTTALDTPVQLVSGAAPAFTTSFDSVGDHSITSAYAPGGDPNYAAATSSPKTETVNTAPPVSLTITPASTTEATGHADRIAATLTGEQDPSGLLMVWGLTYVDLVTGEPVGPAKVLRSKVNAGGESSISVPASKPGELQISAQVVTADAGTVQSNNVDEFVEGTLKAPKWVKFPGNRSVDTEPILEWMYDGASTATYNLKIGDLTTGRTFPFDNLQNTTFDYSNSNIKVSLRPGSTDPMIPSHQYEVQVQAVETEGAGSQSVKLQSPWAAYKFTISEQTTNMFRVRIDSVQLIHKDTRVKLTVETFTDEQGRVTYGPSRFLTCFFDGILLDPTTTPGYFTNFQTSQPISIESLDGDAQLIIGPNTSTNSHTVTSTQLVTLVLPYLPDGFLLLTQEDLQLPEGTYSGKSVVTEGPHYDTSIWPNENDFTNT